MKKIIGIITGAAFLFALGVVGAVERGAAVGLMWMTIPAIIVIGLCAYALERIS